MSHHLIDDPLVARGTELLPSGRVISAAERAAYATTSASTGPALIMCRSRYQFVVALLASWGTGREVILPPNHRQETAREISGSSRPGVILHDGLALGAEDIDIRGVMTDGRRTPLSTELLSTATVASLYTSGTTGKHQAQRKTAGQLLGEAKALAAMLGVARGDRVLATVPALHIYGLLYSVLVPLQSGAVMVDATPFQPREVARAIRIHRPRLLVTVPAHLRALAQLPAGSLAGAHTIVSSTAPLAPELARTIRTQHSVKVVEFFGSSETGGIAWRDPTEDQAWQALPGVTVAADESGHLLVSSPFLPPDCAVPLRCADRIQLAAGTGRFHHIGRQDGVVKIGGNRVSVTALEQRILDLPGVRDAVVASVQVDGVRGTELAAMVVGDGWTPARVRAELRKWWDPVVVPRRITMVGRIPREPNGKVRLASFGDHPSGAADPRRGKVT